MAFCTLYYISIKYRSLSCLTRNGETRKPVEEIATGKQGGPCDSQYVAVNITNGGRNNGAECLQFRDVLLVALPGSQ